MLVTMLGLAAPARTQDNGDPGARGNGYWADWFERTEKTRAEQPRWLTPLATTTPRLEQELRYDIVWQRRPDDTTIRNYGNSKGLELIPFEKAEIIVGVPPYLVHNQAEAQDGFGDWRLLVKYRLLSANEHHGNYIVTAFLDVSVPTGSGSNGAANWIVTPTLAYGTGIGPLDVQGTFGVALPTGNVDVIGRAYTWNNAVQYQLFRKLWPEIEVNASFFQNGKNDGARQVFITPGLVVGRFPLTRRVALTVGAGVQIAVSQFRTSTRNAVLSLRLPF